MERREKKNDKPLLRTFLASLTAPAVITNPDLSTAQPSWEGYVSLTIQSLASEAQVSQM